MYILLRLIKTYVKTLNDCSEIQGCHLLKLIKGKNYHDKQFFKKKKMNYLTKYQQ